MARSRPILVAIVVVLIAAAAWGIAAAVNAIRFGARGSDPAIYWPAVALIVVVVALLLCGARSLTRRLRRM